MKVSVNTIKQLVDFELPATEELVARINAQLGGVEEVIELGERYKDARIVRVVSADRHPDADRLTVCKIDDNGLAPGVERDEQGYIQVVCGAPNVTADMWAVWLPPGSVVPSTFDDDQPFVLDARKLRGVMSSGMLAAGDELAINNDHEGIVELTPQDMPEGTKLVAGASFAEVFELNDTIIDIENKMFTHRPDCFGQLGVAREIAGIFNQRFESSDWYLAKPIFDHADTLELKVFNEAGEKVPRFMATVLRSVEVKPSPLWLQTTLLRWGSKAINNIVDMTNYVMLLTAQPTHAYDYDKLHGHTLGARMARDGEKITLLNGKSYTLTSEDIVIADGEKPVGLGGIMGDAGSEVDENTHSVVLEVANFDMYTLRRTAMNHGVFTDALTRFNKGQSPLQTDRVMQLLVKSIKDVSNAEQASAVYDPQGSDFNDYFKGDTVYAKQPITLTAEFIHERLGFDLSKEDMAGLLKNTELQVSYSDEASELAVQPAFWRTDVRIAEDVVEEVGRLYGFDKLPRELPRRSTKPTPKNGIRTTKQRVRESLSRAGANEVLTYSFVHENVLAKAEQDVSQAFRLSNALSPDLQYYRLTVLPSLLDKVHMNIKAGHDEFTLFEIGKGHNKKYHADDDEGLPKEMQFVDAVYASKQPKEGAPYYYMHRLVSQLGDDHGLTLQFKAIDNPLDYPVTAPFDLTRSALIETVEGVFVGMIGELKQSVLRNFKLPLYTAAMTLDLEGIHTGFAQQQSAYRPLSKYPSTSRDVSIAVDTKTSYSTLWQAAVECAADAVEEVHITPIGVYQPEGASKKNVTFRIGITSHDRTLASDEANDLVSKIADAMCTAADGTIV